MPRVARVKRERSGGYTKSMYYVYILKMSNGDYYTGYTTKLPQRIMQHQQHTVHATKQAKSRELVFYSAFKTKKKAMTFEKYLKSSSGFAFRNKRLV